MAKAYRRGCTLGFAINSAFLPPRMTLRGLEHRRRWAHRWIYNRGWISTTTCLSQVWDGGGPYVPEECELTSTVWFDIGAWITILIFYILSLRKGVISYRLQPHSFSTPRGKMPSLPRTTSIRVLRTEYPCIKKQKIISRQRAPDIQSRELGSHVTDIVNHLGQSVVWLCTTSYGLISPPVGPWRSKLGG